MIKEQSFYWTQERYLFRTSAECALDNKIWEDLTPIMVVSVTEYASVKYERDRLSYLLEEEIKKNHELLNANSGL